MRVFYTSVSKSSQVSRTLLSILADFNNAVVWMVSTRPLISMFSILYTNPLVNVLSGQITIGITVTFMVHSFFSPLARLRYLSLFSLSFSFILWLPRTAKSIIRQILFFQLTITRSGRLAEIGWSVCVSKSHKILCVSFFGTDSRLCIYHLFTWSNLNFLHKFQWMTHSRLVLYLLCANLLHSLIMWLVVLSLSPHNLHLLFCCVLFILALT